MDKLSSLDLRSSPVRAPTTFYVSFQARRVNLEKMEQARQQFMLLVKEQIAIDPTFNAQKILSESFKEIFDKPVSVSPKGHITDLTADIIFNEVFPFCSREGVDGLLKTCRYFHRMTRTRQYWRDYHDGFLDFFSALKLKDKNSQRDLETLSIYKKFLQDQMSSSKSQPFLPQSSLSHVVFSQRVGKGLILVNSPRSPRTTIAYHYPRRSMISQVGDPHTAPLLGRVSSISSQYQVLANRLVRVSLFREAGQQFDFQVQTWQFEKKWKETSFKLKLNLKYEFYDDFNVDRYSGSEVIVKYVKIKKSKLFCCIVDVWKKEWQHFESSCPEGRINFFAYNTTKKRQIALQYDEVKEAYIDSTGDSDKVIYPSDLSLELKTVRLSPDQSLVAVVLDGTPFFEIHLWNLEKNSVRKVRMEGTVVDLKFISKSLFAITFATMTSSTFHIFNTRLDCIQSLELPQKNGYPLLYELPNHDLNVVDGRFNVNFTGIREAITIANGYFVAPKIALKKRKDPEPIAV